jgi:hypothetical protein
VTSLVAPPTSDPDVTMKSQLSPAYRTRDQEQDPNACRSTIRSTTDPFPALSACTCPFLDRPMVVAGFESQPPNAGSHASRPIAPSASELAPRQVTRDDQTLDKHLGLLRHWVLSFTCSLLGYGPAFTIQLMRHVEQGKTCRA